MRWVLGCCVSRCALYQVEELKTHAVIWTAAGGGCCSKACMQVPDATSVHLSRKASLQGLVRPGKEIGRLLQ